MSTEITGSAPDAISLRSKCVPMKPLPPITIDAPMKLASSDRRRGAASLNLASDRLQRSDSLRLARRAQDRRERLLELSGLGLDVEARLRKKTSIAAEAQTLLGIGGQVQNGAAERRDVAGLHDHACL